MKLELEQNAAPSPFVATNLSNKVSGNNSAQINETLKAGINAAKEGRRDDARLLLLRVTENQPDNETAWLWLASISEYPEELLVFLNNVLSINPRNERALEWMKATKSLLAKTFVQRGITASRESQKEFAVQCFYQALGHDSENELAWLWLASVADSPEEKMAHLQKVLWINPENETAQASLASVKMQTAQGILKKANVAAISGDHATARELLDELMQIAPEMEESWILKAYLSDSQDEKILCFEKVLAFNPENETARAGLDSIKAIRERELQRIAQKMEFEAMQNAARPELIAEMPEMSAETEDEEPEIIFAETVEAVAQTVPFAEYSNGFDYAADEDIHKTTAADRNQSETDFMQDGPTQELEEDFIQHLEVLAAFSSEMPLSASQNTPQILEETEEFSAADFETVSDAPETISAFDSTFAIATETKEFDFAPEEAPAEMAIDEPSADSKDFQITQHEDLSKDETSYFDSILARSEDAPVANHDEETSWQSANYSAYTPNFEQTAPEAQPVEPDEDETLMTESFAHNVEPQPENFFGQSEFSAFDSMSESDDAPAAAVSETYESDYSDDFSMEVSADEDDAVYEIAADENASVENFFQASPEPEDAPMQTAPANFDENPAPAIPQPFVEENAAPEFAAVDAAVAETEFSVSHKPVASAASFACPFCTFINEPQSFMCPSCRSVLSLSDLEMLLSNQEADRNYLEPAVERMENEMKTRAFSTDEMVFLGVAHLNLKNLRQGFTYLLDASRLNQNNVVLGSQVNSLAIRLVEIEQQESKNQDAQSRTILVVDDSATVRKLISGKLEKCGHTVLVAVDGMDALAKINEVIPDHDLLDITMPRMDGYQVCKLIRNNNMTKDVPVVMISGKDGFFDKVRGRMAGSTGYITKPFGPDTLMRTIEAYLN